VVIEIGDGGDEDQGSRTGRSPFSVGPQGEVLRHGEPVYMGSIEVRDAGTQTDEGMDHIRLARLVHHISTATTALQQELGLLAVQAPVTPLPGTGSAPATPPGALLAAATASGIPPPPMMQTCPVWFSPSEGGSLTEPAWVQFSATHEDDAYVMTEWSSIDAALPNGLPTWATAELVGKVVSSLRFARPQPPGPMCYHWVPIRALGKMVRSLLSLPAASKLPATELIRLILLAEITEGGETFSPMELLRLTGPIPGSHLVFARAVQSRIRHKVLQPNGAIITRPLQAPAGAKGSSKKK
jgi:hypothetical protein